MALTRIRQNQVIDLEFELQQIKNQIKTFKEPVALFTDLPLDGNNNGDLRVCLEDGNIYIWNEVEQTWNLSSGKGGAYTRTLSIQIEQDNQTEINTKIRFDETGELQTSVEMINLYLNGLLVDPSCFSVSNVNEELIITWLSDEPLSVEDNINVQYYDITGGVSAGGSNGVNIDLKSLINDDTISTDEVWSSHKTNTEIESLKQSVSNGKELLAKSITDKGILAKNTDSFEQLGQKVSQIFTMNMIDKMENISVVSSDSSIKRGDIIDLVNNNSDLESVIYNDITTTSTVHANVNTSFDSLYMGINIKMSDTDTEGFVLYKRNSRNEYVNLTLQNNIAVSTISSDFTRDNEYMVVLTSVEPYVELFKYNSNSETFDRLSDIFITNELSNTFANYMPYVNNCKFTIDGKFLIVYTKNGAYDQILIFKHDNGKLIPYQIFEQLNTYESSVSAAGVDPGKMSVSYNGDLIYICIAKYPYNMFILKYDMDNELFDGFNATDSHIVGESIPITTNTKFRGGVFSIDSKYFVVSQYVRNANAVLVFEINKENNTLTYVGPVSDFPTAYTHGICIDENGLLTVSTGSTPFLVQYQYSNNEFTKISNSYSTRPTRNCSSMVSINNGGFAGVELTTKKVECFVQQGTNAVKLDNLSNVSENSLGVAIVTSDILPIDSSYNATKIISK